MSKINRDFNKAVQHEDYKEVHKLIRHKFGHKLTLEKVGKIAQEHQYEPLMHAVESCKKMKALSDTKVPERDFLEIAFFIEAKLKKHIDKGLNYLKSDVTGLTRTVEFDPKTNLTFIHLKCHNGLDKIGQGYFKTVTKSIQYDRNHPEVVAHSEQTDGVGQEVENLKQTEGVKGIVQARSITTHKEAVTGQTKTCMIFKLYQPGALNHGVIKTLNLDEKHKAATDLLTGLNGLHAKGLVHLDIKSGNVFLEKKGTHVQAEIGDLGQARSIKEASGKRPNASDAYNPPEAFDADLRKIDYAKSDIFSLGCVLHEIFAEKHPKWMDNNTYSKALSKSGRVHNRKSLKESLVKEIKALRESLKKKIENKNEPQKKVQFMKALTGMLHQDPEKRPSIEKLLQIFSS